MWRDHEEYTSNLSAALGPSPFVAADKAAGRPALPAELRGYEGWNPHRRARAGREPPAFRASLPARRHRRKATIYPRRSAWIPVFDAVKADADAMDFEGVAVDHARRRDDLG